MLLDGKVAIVTGGGQGIGKRYCRGLSDEGAQVVVVDIAEEAARQTAAEIGGLAVRADISDEGSVREMVSRAKQAYGKVDILVNNAALFTETLPRRDFDRIPAADWERVLQVNVIGTWLCCSAVAPLFREQRSGVIVNISSNTIYHGSKGFMHYVTSKAAVWGMTHCLANELGDYGVRVNTIAPGLTSSEHVRERYDADYLASRSQARLFKREQLPEDLVGTLVFLCSDRSAFMTGQTISVDGGTILH